MKTTRNNVIKSERNGMKDSTYTAYVLGEAAAYGNSVEFWIRGNDPKQAGRRARLAATLALKVLGREA